ncbi:MAG: hypothetical protein K2N11_05135 [Mucispirillum sp.]|nr:hypothetical protein [Mucispirillum sp.]
MVDRKLVSCYTAIQEANIFENDKTLYKQNLIESRVEILIQYNKNQLSVNKSHHKGCSIKNIIYRL